MMNGWVLIQSDKIPPGRDDITVRRYGDDGDFLAKNRKGNWCLGVSEEQAISGLLLGEKYIDDNGIEL